MIQARISNLVNEQTPTAEETLDQRVKNCKTQEEWQKEQAGLLRVVVVAAAIVVVVGCGGGGGGGGDGGCGGGGSSDGDQDENPYCPEQFFRGEQCNKEVQGLKVHYHLQN